MFTTRNSAENFTKKKSVGSANPFWSANRPNEQRTVNPDLRHTEKNKSGILV